MIIKMHLWDAHEVDAVKDGKKIKLWNARIEVITDFNVECDYQDRCARSAWMKKLKEFGNI